MTVTTGEFVPKQSLLEFEILNILQSLPTKEKFRGIYNGLYVKNVSERLNKKELQFM
ncbi:MAG: hypothetical protein RIS73_2315 [Bacteroidota bacterium]